MALRCASFMFAGGAEDAISSSRYGWLEKMRKNAKKCRKCRKCGKNAEKCGPRFPPVFMSISYCGIYFLSVKKSWVLPCNIFDFLPIPNLTITFPLVVDRANTGGGVKNKCRNASSTRWGCQRQSLVLMQSLNIWKKCNLSTKGGCIVTINSQKKKTRYNQQVVSGQGGW